MRAIVVERPGGPEALALREVEDLPLGPGEIRIRVAAAGVNRADVAQREGEYPSPPGAPEWPGLEVSGTVSEVGAGVDRFGAGDEVCALLAGGGYAEEVVVDAQMALPVPEGVGLVEAAALPEVVATVWSNLFRSAEVGAGDVVLVHGGASGVGSMAIQMARLAGARVATTAGSAEKLAFCAGLGAETLINYREEDFAERIAETYPGGADVILDIVGGANASANIRALATDGILVVIANQSGERMSFNPFALMMKRGRLWGTTLRARPVAEKRAIVADMGRRLWPAFASGALRPVVDSVLPFSRAADAHRRMEASEHVGKILLTP
ncbi:NAD(P)H-quinone oxidoreductase [Leucobacter sp. CSA1]|uniref:NAD(P)H-quinone oxidoreductase n=1 Tax=Leucobacter chromiisoli TaxID=2796471 RepID=A0A934UUH3_9MICO|nr:NAD(P)H-quinone oxidoreductase [Leucobacter chromiisoli]MBK0419494.1 NAD(P)H-quinone oxidoreductase [Leucobacter chromiisoli]